jgi:DNA-binding response OmpR family regulator
MVNEVILLVEDDSKSRKLVRDLLTFKGYEIIEAGTGEEGVRLAQGESGRACTVKAWTGAASC